MNYNLLNNKHMKKFKFLPVVLGLLIVAFMASCTKEGVYNPKKKIQRVYSAATYTDKYLSEVWNWEGKLLKSVDHFYSGGGSYTETFTYDGNRLIRVDDYRNSEYATYDYDGSVLKTYNYYYKNQLSSTINFTYDGKKLSQVVYTIYDDKKGESHLMPPIPAEMRESLNVLAAKADATKGLFVINYKFTWTDDNITRMVGTAEGEMITVTLGYDTKTNPFKGFLNLYAVEDPYCFYSKNNVIQFMETYLDGDNDIYNYNYQYDGDGYPTMVIRTRVDSEYSYSTFYEYDK